MIRKIIEIDKEKCNGCGLCAHACHEGAIGMVDGKATLLRDDYCDGLGNCLPVCPTGAISFVEREAAAYDEAAVQANMQAKSQPHTGCPGSMARSMERAPVNQPASFIPMPSQLRQWPVQIKLVPVNAPYFDGASLLIAADCTAYAYANFHQDFIRGKVTLVGCPKLDDVDYSGEADRNPPSEQHQKRNRCPHGGAVLRRIGIRRSHGAAELRQAAAVAGEDHFHQGRPAGRLTDSCRFH